MTSSSAALREGADALRRDKIGFVFQAYNLDPDADRGREHHAPAGARRPQARPGVARPGDRHRRASATGSRTGRPSCPAVSSSASPWPGRSSASPRSSSPTSPPATSTRSRARRSSTFMRQAVDDFGQTIVMVTHDPDRRRATPTASCSSPTADRRRDARPDRRTTSSTRCANSATEVSPRRCGRSPSRGSPPTSCGSSSPAFPSSSASRSCRERSS